MLPVAKRAINVALMAKKGTKGRATAGNEAPRADRFVDTEEGVTPFTRSTPKAGKPSALLDTRVIYCGDNLEHLAKLPDRCIDLIYIDPPFKLDTRGAVVRQHA